MKILYLISHLADDGPVHALRDIIRGFRDSADDDITVLTLSDPGKDLLKPQFDALAVNYLNIPVSKRRPFRALRAVRAILSAGDYDVAGSACIRADAILALSTLGISHPKIVATVHNIPAEDFGFLFPGWRGRAYARLHYLVLRRFGSRLVCVSNVIRDHLEMRIGARGVRVLNPAVVDQSQVHGFAPQPVVVYAASISQRKNPGEAIDFFLSVAPPGYKLDIYGRGPLEDELRSRHAGDDRVQWHGFTRDLPNVLGKAAAYVSASMSEGLPLAPQVALLSGCPCVLSDIPQHRELAQMSKHVFIYRLGDREDFARAMQGALQADRERVRHDARDLAAVISPKASAQTLRQFYLSW